MLAKHSYNHVLVTLHEGPTIDPLGLAAVGSIFENLLFLLLGAVKGLVLLHVLSDSVPRRWHGEIPATYFLPVDVSEEGVHLDLVCTACSGTQTLAWVPVEQVDDQVLGFLRHAYGQLEHASLNVVEKLIPKNSR